MASTFHLGAYHELADTFTLGFEETKKGSRRKKKAREEKGILSFSMNFLLFSSLPFPHRKRAVTLLRSLPKMPSIYINNHPRLREHLIDVSLSKDCFQAFE